MSCMVALHLIPTDTIISSMYNIVLCMSVMPTQQSPMFVHFSVMLEKYYS